MLFARLTSRWALGWLAAALGVPLLLATALTTAGALTP
ncbi:L,D-transpeptidase, partial [Micromonospora sp. KC207]